MPLVATVIGFLMSACGSLVGRVLLALGMGYVSYKGFDLSVTWCLTQIKTNISAMPVEVMNFFGWLWLDKAIGMIFAAYTAATVVKFGTSGALTKIAVK